MFGEPFTYAIVACAGFGYFGLAFLLNFRLIIKLTFIICGMYLIAYGLFIQTDGFAQITAIGLMILPFVTIRIFDSKFYNKPKNRR